jgi:hypothetical protein
MVLFQAAFAGIRRKGGDVFRFSSEATLFDPGDTDDPFGRPSDEPTDFFVFNDSGWKVGAEGSDE